MRKWYTCSICLFLVGAGLALPASALEVGDRAPKLTLPNAAGEPLAFPNQDLKYPVLVWFPQAWRTPDSLCQKLINVTESNHTSLVVIPVFDAVGVSRYIQHSTAVNSSSEQSSSPDPATSSSSPEQQEEVQELPNEPTTAAQTAPEDSTKDLKEYAQEGYRQRLQKLAKLYPKAHFLCDLSNEALMGYTESYSTNLLPNPDLFLIDAHGYVTWKAFYPGLTVGTLNRAIISSQPQRNNN